MFYFIGKKKICIQNQNLVPLKKIFMSGVVAHAFLITAGGKQTRVDLRLV